MEPKQIAEQLLGLIDWQNEVTGFCKCPGESLHTSRNGDKDCRVSLDGAPTIHCFHSSCSKPVEEVNHKLRSQLGATDWKLLLPNGATLRSRDLLTASGGIMRREMLQAQARCDRLPPEEKQIIENLKQKVTRFRHELFERYY